MEVSKIFHRTELYQQNAFLYIPLPQPKRERFSHVGKVSLRISWPKNQMLFISADENGRLDHESLETFRSQNLKVLIEKSSRAVTSSKCTPRKNNVITYIRSCLNQADFE